MPWLDPSRRFESAEDRELRDELRDLLGVAPEPANFFGVEPTPELVALADKLRSEAERRRRTDRTRPLWTLLAAALPIALVLGGLSVWGHQQERRANQLAAEIQRRERETQQGAAAQLELTRTRAALEQARAEVQARQIPKKREHGLVIPVERTQGFPAPETQAVKSPR